MAVLAKAVGACPSGAAERTLLIACGALAREIVELIRLNDWQHLTVSCLPASWHNTPAKIPEGVRGRIRDARGKFDRIRSEEHTSELQSLMRISYAVFCLKNKKNT